MLKMLNIIQLWNEGLNLFSLGVRSVSVPLTLFQTALKFVFHFHPLVFESLKGFVKGSIWLAGKTISIGRLLGSGFAEKNASSTIYGNNKPNILSNILTN